MSLTYRPTERDIITISSKLSVFTGCAVGLGALEGAAADVACTDVDLMMAGEEEEIDDVTMWTVEGSYAEVGCTTDVLMLVVGTEEVDVGNGCTVVEFAAGWVADDVMVEDGMCVEEICETVASGKSGRQAPLYGRVILYCKEEQ